MPTSTHPTVNSVPAPEAPRPSFCSLDLSYDTPKKYSTFRKLVPRRLTSPPSYEEVFGETYQYSPATANATVQAGTGPSPGPGAEPGTARSYGPEVTPFVQSKKDRRKPSSTLVRREINWAGFQTLLPGVKGGCGNTKPKTYSWEAAALARP